MRTPTGIWYSRWHRSALLNSLMWKFFLAMCATDASRHADSFVLAYRWANSRNTIKYAVPQSLIAL
jgi:hypothetical protein